MSFDVVMIGVLAVMLPSDIMTVGFLNLRHFLELTCLQIFSVFLWVELKVVLSVLLVILVEDSEDVDQTYQVSIVFECLEVKLRVV